MHRKRPRRRILVNDLNDPACSRIDQNRMLWCNGNAELHHIREARGNR
jgi:hypothetical protein